MQNRRLILKIVLLATAGVFFQTMSTAAPNHSKYILYVGTYGKGVYGYRYDAADGSLEPLSVVGEVQSPSWVGTDPKKQISVRRQ